MLSIGGIRSAGRAADYYGKDDYYVTGEADTAGLEWKGKGSVQLGLAGVATHADFKTVLEGKDPRSPEDRLTRGKAGPNGEVKHKAGWDLTFSAPKSSSLLILIGGDKARDRGFIDSTEKAMAYAEKWFSVTRVRDGAGHVKEKITGTLTYGQTVHGTSREGDPQRHVHYPVANATYDKDTGQWRALESKHLFKNQLFLGRLQRAYDIAAAKEQGYNVKVGKDETWEVDGFTREQLRAFSKAHARVQATLERSEARSDGAKNTAILKERPRKIDVPRSELESRWRLEARRLGMDPSALVREAQSRDGPGADLTAKTEGRVSETASQFAAWLDRMAERITQRSIRADPYGYETGARNRDVEARRSVSFGLQVSEQRRAVFTRHEVLDNAMKASRLQVSPDRLIREMDRLELEGKIQPAEKQVLAGITSSHALGLERSIVETMEAGRGQGRPIFEAAAAKARLSDEGLALAGAKIELNQGQRDGAQRILASPDKYVAVQGFAGTGKTTMFSIARAAAAERGAELVAVAPTHRAVAALETEAGITGKTVTSFLLANERLTNETAIKNNQAWWSQKTLIVDEASMLSNDTAHRIIAIAEKLQIPKVVFVGDERQLGSPHAGAPFRLLLDEKVDQARLTEIRRQRDPEHRVAVEMLAKGEGGKGLAALGDRVVEIGRSSDEKALASAAADHWRAGRASGSEPAIIVPTNALRGLVANNVRETLKDEGALASVGELSERYYAVNLVGPQRHRADSYELGQRLVFHSAMRALGVKRGDEGTIVGLDHRNDRLAVDMTDGARRTIDLRAIARDGHDKFQAYNVREHEVAVGERLVWERADAARGLMTGAPFQVLAMSPREWTVRHGTGVEETFAHNDRALKFAWYGYAETADRSQGQTYKEAIAVLGSFHGEAANNARAYVQGSRPAEKITFIIDDKALLRLRLNMQSGLNAIALQALRDVESPDKENPAQSREPLGVESPNRTKLWEEDVRSERADKAISPPNDALEPAPARNPDMLAVSLAPDKDDKDRAFVLDVPMPSIDKSK